MTKKWDCHGSTSRYECAHKRRGDDPQCDGCPRQAPGDPEQNPDLITRVSKAWGKRWAR